MSFFEKFEVSKSNIGQSNFLSLAFLEIDLSCNISKSSSKHRRKEKTLPISMDDPNPLNTN